MRIVGSDDHRCNKAPASSVVLSQLACVRVVECPNIEREEAWPLHAT